jgi:peroxiredoxin
MRRLACLSVSAVLLLGSAWAGDPPKEAPKVVLRSADGKKEYDLAKLLNDGPVLVRLTCACTGCDAELPYFQKLQAAYDAKGLKTVAVFKEKPEAAETYTVKKGVRFLWLEDPNGDLWKTFDATAMPTNILIDKGGKVVKVIAGCTKDGKNAQDLSAEIARLLRTPVAKVTDEPSKPSPK